MALVSLCPFPAELLLWEAEPGQTSLTVIVKVTLRLVQGADAAVADEQLPIGGDEAWDDSPTASLFRPSDRAPLKPKTDIIVVGHVYTPGEMPVCEITAHVKIGDFQKSIQATAARPWIRGENGFVAGAPVPFTQMALRYELAALSPDNPVGIDAAAPPLEGAPAFPNLNPVAPATFGCFGPIASAWRPRRRLLAEAGRFWALAFETGGQNPESAPRGVDFRYFNSAPPDQQANLLRQRAEIELINLHPSEPILKTRLPALRPQAFRLDPRSRKPVEVALRCDTLWIDTDRSIATLLWRGLTDVPAHVADPVGTVVVVADPQGRRVRWEQVDRAMREGVPIEATEPAAEDALALRHDKVRTKGESEGASPPKEERDETRLEAPVTSTGTWRAALPFLGAENAPPLAESRPSISSVHNASASVHNGPSGVHNAPERVHIAAPGVHTPPPPFPAPVVPKTTAANLVFDEDTTHSGTDEDTADRAPDVITSPLPFTKTGSLPAAPPPDPPKPAPVPPTFSLPPAPALLAVPPAPAGVRAPASTAPPPLAIPLQTAPAPFVLGSPAARKPEIAAPKLNAPAVVHPPKVVIGPAAPKADPKPAAETPPPDPPSVPIAQYGAISAELMIRRGERPKVLEEHKLSEPVWARIHSHWTGEMGRETARGESKLLAEFDEAYVDTMGRLRKPIGVPEYASILVAIESGAVDKQLSLLSLSLSDLMRVQRVWTRRIADDPELGRALNKAVEEARNEQSKEKKTSS
ncbi:MAG: DUF2169 domain-containing protein [Polyangiaceae bacterium]|nr:DUF2169 domain-containing protein [Polyangiaceae bacterium]